MSDLYNILGVDRSANPEEIKRAYRKLAAQHHPDRGGDTKKFQEIQAAYDTLGDPEKKAAYDNPQPQMGGFHFHGNGFPPGFEDIFAQFSNGSPFDAMFGRRQPQRNKNLSIHTKVTLEEAYVGKDLIATIKLPSGREQLIEIKIPPGIQNGTTLRLGGIGDDSIPNIPRGDIHLTIEVLPHNIFNRQGDDLSMQVSIDCIEAMLGVTKKINTIDGKTLEIAIRPGTQPDQILAIQGYGMPNMNDNRFKGRMLITVKVTIPSNLTDAQKDILKHFAE